jgi:hypothetical protein
MGCEDKIITNNHKLEHNKKILGNWVLEL